MATLAAEDSALGAFVALDWVLRPAVRAASGKGALSSAELGARAGQVVGSAVGGCGAAGADGAGLAAAGDAAGSEASGPVLRRLARTSWRLGVRAEPPIGIPDSDESGLIVPGSEVYCLPANRSRPPLLAAKRSQKEQELDEPLR